MITVMGLKMIYLFTMAKALHISMKSFNYFT